MIIGPFNKDLVKHNPELFKFIEQKSLWYPIYYILDSRVRDAKNLQVWLNDNVSVIPEEVANIVAQFNMNQDADYIMVDILRWVKENIVYTTDNKVYKTPEKWQTAAETIKLKTGDCEDGAILIYTLAIHCGIPPERLLLFAGDVDGGGHCWCGYRSTEYPLNWCFMDWCYWYDPTTPSARTKYYILGSKIYDDPKNQYYDIWFAFNHVDSFKGIMNK